jgi:hypothetical protein
MASVHEATQQGQAYGVTRERHGPEPDRLVVHAAKAGTPSSDYDALSRFRAIAVGMAFSDAACAVVALAISYLVR